MSGDRFASKEDLEKEDYIMDLMKDFFKKTQDYSLDEFDESYLEKKVKGLLQTSNEIM